MPKGKRSMPHGKRGGHAGRPVTTDATSEDNPTDSKATLPRIIWNPMRTERLVEWLENNVEDRQRLFSDSAQDAKEEHRRRRTAKNGKSSFYLKIADYIFSLDEDVRFRDDLRTNGPKRYGKAVENRIAR
jgi:hypothetical protein